MLFAGTHASADFTLYHTAEKLLSKAAAIKEHNSNYISTTSCAALPDLPVYTLTSQHPYSHIGTNKLRLLLNFGEHGRELITSEVALTLLRFIDSRSRQLEREQKQQSIEHTDFSDLADEYEYDRYIDETDNDLSAAYLAFLLRNTHTTVIPLLNRWGHERVEAGEVCSRKNSAGVDLNRNYDFLHSHNTAPAFDETYAGTAPFTEPESQCLAQLASLPAAAPTVYVNVHSGIQELYFGWDHTASPAIPNQREVTRLYEHINSYHCSCKVGAAGKIAGYVVYGGSMDWMYSARNVSYSLTYEVYGDSTAVPGDCFKTFNPQSRAALQDTCYRFATSFFSMMDYLIVEKFNIVFPYRPPSFTLTQLFMTEDKKTRDKVKVYYHTWQQLITKQFNLWTATGNKIQSIEDVEVTTTGSSKFGLPVFDPNSLLTGVAAKGGLRVLLIGSNQSNAFFPTELLYHLSHQYVAQSYNRHVHLVILPTLFPTSRSADQLCSAGLSAEERMAMAAELYEAEEEVERVSRVLRPHVVVELVMPGAQGEEQEGGGETAGKTKGKKRARNDVFDIFHHNDSSSDANFVSSAVKSLSTVHKSIPFTSPLSLSTHLHLRLVYRGYTPPTPDKMSARRRASDRYPPAHYLTPPDSLTPVRCDWDDYNPPPTELVDHLTPAMNGLHTLLEAVSELRGKKWSDVVLREEADEEVVRRAGLFVDDGMGVRSNVGSRGSEWMPSVWESGGAGWRGWLLLFLLIFGLVVGGVVGATWIRAQTRTMKAAVAV